MRHSIRKWNTQLLSMRCIACVQPSISPPQWHPFGTLPSHIITIRLLLIFISFRVNIFVFVSASLCSFYTLFTMFTDEAPAEAESSFPFVFLHVHTRDTPCITRNLILFDLCYFCVYGKRTAVGLGNKDVHMYVYIANILVKTRIIP